MRLSVYVAGAGALRRGEAIPTSQEGAQLLKAHFAWGASPSVHPDSQSRLPLDHQHGAPCDGDRMCRLVWSGSHGHLGVGRLAAGKGDVQVPLLWRVQRGLGCILPTKLPAHHPSQPGLVGGPICCPHGSPPPVQNQPRACCLVTGARPTLPPSRGESPCKDA